MSRIDWREALIKKANSQLKGGMHHEIDKNTRKIAGERKNLMTAVICSEKWITNCHMEWSENRYAN